ncbi:MAG: type VI secretion system baseplate subunit TssK [Planctomycetota bacterium]
MGREAEPEVHWSEGMLLRPQHFQALARHIASRVGDALTASHPFGWGIRHLEIAEAGVENFEFAVLRADIVFADGTVLLVPGNGEVASRSFKDQLDRARGPLLVYLGLRDVTERVCDAASGRFQVVTESRVDENSGDSPREIALRRLRAALFFGSEDRSGFACVPIATVERRAAEQPVPILSPEYCPPLLRLQSDRKVLNLLRELDQALTNKNRALAEQIKGKRISFSSDTGGDSEALFKLQVINGALLPYRQIASEGSLHPYDAYLLLLRLAGELAIFAEERVPKELPLYQHENALPCFRAAASEIHRLLNAMVPMTFAQRAFQKNVEFPGALVADLDPSWVNADSDLYVGIDCAAGEPYVLEKVRPRVTLKLVEPGAVARVAKERLPGIRFERVARVPAELPNRSDCFYFQCDRKDADFAGVAASRKMALTGDATRDDKLRFSLFVIPR